MRRRHVFAWLLTAWVLWAPRVDETGNGRPSQFVVIESYVKRAECDALALQLNSAIKARFPQNPTPGLARCLPDTVDPRDPKR